jgi:hypothetical protein
MQILVQIHFRSLLTGNMAIHGIMIPARFLTTMGHFVATIMIFYSTVLFVHFPVLATLLLAHLSAWYLPFTCLIAWLVDLHLPPPDFHPTERQCAVFAQHQLFADRL